MRRLRNDSPGRTPRREAEDRGPGGEEPHRAGPPGAREEAELRKAGSAARRPGLWRPPLTRRAGAPPPCWPLASMRGRAGPTQERGDRSRAPQARTAALPTPGAGLRPAARHGRSQSAPQPSLTVPDAFMLPPPPPAGKERPHARLLHVTRPLRHRPPPSRPPIGPRRGAVGRGGCQSPPATVGPGFRAAASAWP